jgi:nitrogen fixation NifU-like protein
MNSNIYQEELLSHYHHPQNYGRLKGASRSISLNNPLCGDMITMDIELSHGTIRNVSFEGEGCVLSMASASLLTDYIKGKSPRDVLQFTPQTMLELTRVTVGPTRLKCMLLPLEAAQRALLDNT